MRIALCDDDEQSRIKYGNIIKKAAQKRRINILVNEYATGAQLMFSLSDTEMPPDIVILDIFMPGLDGISTARQMRAAGFTGIIVFLSCSDEYMLPAFDVGAFNYVLKDDEDGGRFERVLQRAVERVLIQDREYVLLNGISEHRNIPIAAISYFESHKHIIIVHYGVNKTFEFLSTLSKVENAMIAYGFVRIHRSFIVNSAAVESFSYDKVILYDGTVLPMGRKRLNELKKTTSKSAIAELDERNESTQL